MPVPDETNNFATHGKAPIPSNASGSFVVPRDKEVGPKDDDDKKAKTPPPPMAAPSVVTAPPDTSSVGIAAPPAGAAFVTAPPSSTTMAPTNAPGQSFAISPFAAQPIAPQMPQPMPQGMSQQMPMQQQMVPPYPMPQMPQGMPQQYPMQMPQGMPQQMPMQQQMMPPYPMPQMPQGMPQQQVPTQIVAPPPMATMSASPSPMTLPAAMTPARVAQMQAQILANALIASQSASRARRKQTYKRSEDDPGGNGNNDYEEPTQQDIRDEKPIVHTTSNITHGERIILPIHDIERERQREDMSRRMTELLGDEEEEPVEINTKTAKKLKKEADKKAREDNNDTMSPEQIQEAEERVQDQVQAQMAAEQGQQPTETRELTPAERFPSYTLSGEAIAPQDPLIDPLDNPKRRVARPVQAEEIPIPQAQVYTLETQIQESESDTEQQQEYVEQEYRPQTPENSRDITSQMQDAQVQTQIPEQMQSMDPRIAAIQQQKLMQQEEAKLAEQQKAQEAAQAAAQAQAEQAARAQQPHVRANSGRLNPNRKSIRVNPEVVKRAALATLLKRPAPQPEPEPEPIEAIRPAYVEELEQQVAGDMKKQDGESEMAALMAAELADDEITQNASQIKVETKEEVAQKEAAAVAAVMPDEVLKAIENASPASDANPNIAVSPNIATSPNIAGSPNINAG